MFIVGYAFNINNLAYLMFMFIFPVLLGTYGYLKEKPHGKE